MSSQLAWHSENQVLQLKLAGNITSDGLLKSSEFVSSLLDENQSHRVHVIVDMLQVSALPRDTGSLRNVLAPMLSHRSLGWTVVITRNLMVQSALNRTVNGVTDRWGYVGSLTEAIDLLKRTDSRLWTVPSTEQKNPLLQNIR
jgi:hypothetical protein